ncbi:hypothetical protein UAM5_00002 [Ralstonia phage UAM5]|nr:hypothetical protein UAM5_00002 [Ralstonia phage UAM5]
MFYPELGKALVAEKSRAERAAALAQLVAANHAACAAMVLARVLVKVEAGTPLPAAYDEVFGDGAYAALASDIHDAANAR